ncbi:MAG: DUF853 family protein [Candidatus Manganitrophus sp.]|nr:DUF853 family protein [Candidatus Manganitrophus sp.]
MPQPILIAKGEHDLTLLPKMANRHGLIAGATGTGKTVTLQTLAEGFCRTGVPVFLADVKGDLSGLAQPGEDQPSASRSAWSGNSRSPTYAPPADPTVFWDVFGKGGPPGAGHRVRHGAAAARPPAGAERHAERRAVRLVSRSPTTRACCCST